MSGMIATKPAAPEATPDRTIDAARRRRTLIGLMGQVFIVMTGISIVSPVMPLYAQSFGVSAAAVGSLITAFGLARIAVNMPAGSLAERFGRRPLLIIGPLITSLSAVLTATAGQFGQLVLFRFIQGVGSAAQTTAAMIAVADISTDGSRGRTMSMYQGSLLLGSSVGPIIGGFVSARYGYRAPFFVYAGMACLAALWAYLAVPETKSVGGTAAVRLRRAGGSRGTDTTPAAQRPTIASLLVNANFMLISLVTLTIFFTRTGSRSTILPLLGYNTLGLSEAQLGMTFTLISLFNFGTINASGILCDRFGRKAVIVPSSIVSGIALVLFTLSRSYTAFLLSGAVLGIGTGLAGPAPAAYVADIATPGSYGLTMGLYRTFGDVGVSVGPVLLGWIADRLGYGNALWVNAAMFLVSGAAFGLLARETVRRRRHECRDGQGDDR